ncbi:MAG: hypothetical protein IKQ16_02345 [Lentisphaeria bacterium]|nr:hypothetical protein [Lentisphaeria bacterium]
MADKNVRLKTLSGDYVYPVTPLSNITLTTGPAISVSGNTIGCTIAAAGTTATAVAGVVKPDSTYFSVDQSGFMSPKKASTSALGVCKFNSTYFSVSSGVVSPKEAGTSQKGVVALATSQEALVGTNNEKAVTPAALHAAFSLPMLVDVSAPSAGEIVDYTGPFILVFDTSAGKWRVSNILKRLLQAANIGDPFDSSDEDFDGFYS